MAPSRFTPAQQEGRKQKRLEQSDVIVTLRRLMAAMIRKHGTFDRLYLSRAEVEAVMGGELKVADRPDGTIELRLVGAAGGKASALKLN